jgi:hypothetical protein
MKSMAIIFKVQSHIILNAGGVSVRRFSLVNERLKVPTAYGVIVFF